MHKDIKRAIKNFVEKTGLIVLNWYKKEKLITFVLAIILLHGIVYNIHQFGNEIKFGKFSVFKKLPSNTGIIGSIFQNPQTLGISYFAPLAVKTDEDNILFFVRNINAESYGAYNLNLKNKKFKKYVSEFGYPEIKFAEKSGNKIFMIFSKTYDFENPDDMNGYNEHNYIVVYDYVKDVVENTTEIKEVLKNNVLPHGFQKIKINDKEYIMYNCMDRCNILQKSENPYFNHTGVFLCDDKKINYYRKLFDVKTAESKEFDITGTDKEKDIFISQTENGISLFYKKNEKGYLISAWDLDKEKKSGEYDLKIRAYDFNIFSIGNNKFMSASRQYDVKGATIIDTFNVDDTGKITKIASLKIKDEKGIINSFKIFPYNNYIVLNPNTVIISGGYDGSGSFYHVSKKTYVLNYETNEFKRITDFKFSTPHPNFIKSDNNSFLMYGVLPGHNIDILHLKDMNKIYKFKLKEGV